MRLDGSKCVHVRVNSGRVLVCVHSVRVHSMRVHRMRVHSMSVLVCVLLCVYVCACLCACACVSASVCVWARNRSSSNIPNENNMPPSRIKTRAQ